MTTLLKTFKLRSCPKCQTEHQDRRCAVCNRAAALAVYHAQKADPEKIAAKVARNFAGRFRRNENAKQARIKAKAAKALASQAENVGHS